MIESEPAAATEMGPFAGLGLPIEPTDLETWRLVEEGFDLAREHEIESLMAVANGYLGTRAALEERSPLSRPATYLAGVFTRSPEGGETELATIPDWTALSVLVNGNRLTLQEGQIVEHRRILDMRNGVLWREWRHRDPAGRITRLRFLRLASLADRHVLLGSVWITPENYSGRIRLAMGEDTPAGMNSEMPGRASSLAVYHASATVDVAVAIRESMVSGSGELLAPHANGSLDGNAARWEWEADIGTCRRFDRLVTVYTSRETEDPAAASLRRMRELADLGVATVVQAHAEAWRTRWEESDVQIDGDPWSQRALRLAVYHLVSAANPEDGRTSVGARALTGDGYKGHVFWDTEIYLLPFHCWTWPGAARAMLLYRHHTLPAARAKAARLGYRGALYAWESADTGEETAPDLGLTLEGEEVPILTGTQAHHVSADVAYAVWHYWQISGDDAFFLDAGAEVILETARFWASRGRVEADGRFHIRQVIGPDEYHEGVDDNAYTNVMAQWNLERGVETAALLRERWPERWQPLAERLHVREEELAKWRELAAAMYLSRERATGVLEQFEGFSALEEIDLSPYERPAPIDVLLGRNRVQGAQVIKQADVVALLALLWNRFPHSVAEASFRYYEPRAAQGSSLSPALHSLVAARLGESAMAERYFRLAADIDLADNMGNAVNGVHIGALGGLWQAAVLGVAGLHRSDDGLVLDPHLLPTWAGLRFSVRWRGAKLQVTLAQDAPEVRVGLDGDAPMRVAVTGGPSVQVTPHSRYRLRRHEGNWGSWEPENEEGHP